MIFDQLFYDVSSCSPLGSPLSYFETIYNLWYLTFDVCIFEVQLKYIIHVPKIQMKGGSFRAWNLIIMEWRV